MAYLLIWLLWLQDILEERCARLEGEACSDLMNSTNGSRILANGLAASFEHMVNEQRDHELIDCNIYSTHNNNNIVPSCYSCVSDSWHFYVRGT
ncbi:hypothetical protein ALC60_07298 [Trachymyrmex zeteki]|uniref:Uncharacterized protein n=1 Tax=Mycetomoellerius zeteki TaxID=64791 RepID=A0A151X0C0_9HYME|nr:hypothetical protein ALC60_07298 [Trachymyrmex zeteki]